MERIYTLFSVGFKDGTERFGYELLENGVPVQRQPYEPGANGIVLMTREEAQAFAEAAIAEHLPTH